MCKHKPHKPHKHKIKPVSYNEYFNVGDRILVDYVCDDKKHHDCPGYGVIVKPAYPEHKPEKPILPHPEHKPCTGNGIWTDSCDDGFIYPDHCHEHLPENPEHKPDHPHKPELIDYDGDGFIEGTFVNNITKY